MCFPGNNYYNLIFIIILIADILDKYCIKHGRKLELFARNLLPGWTCWGNEVIFIDYKNISCLALVDMNVLAETLFKGRDVKANK